jgi:hypothetical protein
VIIIDAQFKPSLNINDRRTVITVIRAALSGRIGQDSAQKLREGILVTCVLSTGHCT